MIEWIIRRSVANRFLVLMGALFLSIWGTWTIINTPVDALPDLSDVQVIIKTSYPGQAPQIVENQVTYPLTTTMLSVPGAKTVRGFSQFGDSYVYVIFEDGTDPYWARSRVLEYLNQVQGKLPAGVSAELGPDATGVGWIYEYALVDRSGKHDLADLRSLQDWFLKYELKTIPDVAEVASVGGVCERVSGGYRSSAPGAIWHQSRRSKKRAGCFKPGSGRFVDRTGGSGIYGASQRLSANARRL